MKSKSAKRLCVLGTSVMMLFSAMLPVQAFTAADPGESAVSETDPELCRKSIALYPCGEEAEATVTLEGLMPENASAAAVDVTADYTDCGSLFFGSEPEETQPASVLAAYDITITDGDTVYQPSEDKPIRVEITAPQLDGSSNMTLWHISDDGTQEQITDFTYSDGTLSFYASGFSVYAIVDGPSPIPLQYAASAEELTAADSGGFYLSYVNAESDRLYFRNEVNGNNALYETADIDEAAVWFFEGSPAESYLYTFIQEEETQKKYYLYRTSGNQIGLSTSQKTALTLSEADTNKFYLKHRTSNRWLQHSIGGGGIRFWTDTENSANSQIMAAYADSYVIPNDAYGLDGKTYGLINHVNGTYGYAMMAEAKGSGTLSVLGTLTRVDPLTHSGSHFIAENRDIAMWTFHTAGGDRYRISAEAPGGGTLWLQIRADGQLMLTDDAAEASEVRVVPDETGKISLFANGYAVSCKAAYDPVNSLFEAAAAANAGSQILLTLVTLSELNDEDFVQYSAEKTSISAPADGDEVIIYTRVWNSSLSKYEYYAIDRNGGLVPCYESGDNILWIGSQVNTMTWRLSEYRDENGRLTGYYDLYNEYSGNYISPLLSGQLVSNKKPGLTIPGRKKDAYYSRILGWDDAYFSYIGMKPDTEQGTLISASKSKSATFYFAKAPVPSEELTPLQTVDNRDYGITMRMYDVPVTARGGPQDIVLNDSTASHNREALQGLLTTDLKRNGYPDAATGGHSLAELYTGEHEATEVNHLFLESTYNETGYFEFDSTQSFATLYDPEGNLGTDFYVYRELGTTNHPNNAVPTLAHGQFFPYDQIHPGVYSTRNPYNLYNTQASRINFTDGALPETDPRKYERLYSVGNNPNYFNVMELEAGFIQTPGGKDAWGHDVIFEFTGDDDFWLYVDGELIIDLGGVHSALAGSVNFSTGEVKVNGENKTLYGLFYENYKSRGHTEAEARAYADSLFILNSNGQYVFNNYSTHTMKMFYMERGAGASNLHMRFNLSSITPGNVMLSKDLTGIDEEDLDFSLVEYPFRIFYREGDAGAFTQLTSATPDGAVRNAESGELLESVDHYKPTGCPEIYNGVFFLQPGETVSVSFPPGEDIEYYIEECGINAEVYDAVRINDRPAAVQTRHSTAAADYIDYSPVSAELSDRPNVHFENHVDQGKLRSLTIGKELYAADGETMLSPSEDPTEFELQLYLAGERGELELANMCKYRMKDENGCYLLWDSAAEQFVSSGKTDFSELTADEKIIAVFETSINGSVSKVRANYKIEVPNLPVGTRFMVTEANHKIPLGYRLIGYERVEGSYITEEGETENSGLIRPSQSPEMAVKNQRGWGLEAIKIWSDAASTESHDPVYVAVYLGGQLLTGSVRKIEAPQTSVRYYFPSLEANADFADYTVREVQLTNPAADSAGSVTYDSITALDEDDIITLSAVSAGTHTAKEEEYRVSYDQGSPAGAAENQRTASVTNTPKQSMKLRLFKWGDKTAPLQNGQFTLTYNGENVGPAYYYTDAEGCITILYYPETDGVYTLTETNAPAGYIGMEHPVTFTAADLTDNPNGAGWAEYQSGDANYIAYINIFNPQVSFRAVKTDSSTGEALAGVHFALYPAVKNNSGNDIRDYYPLAGFGDLVTEADGTVPGISETLPHRKYYLVEKETLPDYLLPDEDIEFTVSARGTISAEGANAQYLTETVTDGQYVYVLSIPNTQQDTAAQLTVTKRVTGSLGNRTEDFTFTLQIAGSTASDVYPYTKNGQSAEIRSGGSFTLSDGEAAVFDLPKNADITITEDNTGYETTFRLDAADPVSGSAVTFSLTDDAALTVTNHRNAVLPSGIRTGAAAGLVIFPAAGAAVLLLRRKRRRRENDADA